MSVWSLLGVLGGVASSAVSVIEANAMRDFISDEARKQRQWEERMTRNAHSYEVEDLRNAGLNPILSANSGATVPQGSAGISSGMADFSGISQIGAIAKAFSEVDLNSAQAEKARADADYARYSTLDKNIALQQQSVGLDQSLSALQQSKAKAAYSWQKEQLERDLLRLKKTYSGVENDYLEDFLKSRNLAEKARAPFIDASTAKSLSEMQNVRKQGEWIDNQNIRNWFDTLLPW